MAINSNFPGGWRGEVNAMARDGSRVSHQRHLWTIDGTSRWNIQWQPIKFDRAWDSIIQLENWPLWNVESLLSWPMPLMNWWGRRLCRHTRNISVVSLWCRMPMLDLLIHVTAANKIPPSSHVLQVTDENRRLLAHMPSTPIGNILLLLLLLLSSSSSSGHRLGCGRL